MNKTFVCHVWDKATYILEAETPEMAAEMAQDMFDERKHGVSVSAPQTPCQVGQDCPDNLNCTSCVALYAKMDSDETEREGVSNH